MIGFSLDRPPEEAIALLESKGYDIGFDWKDVWQEAHQKAFTVAKAMSLDILEDIRTGLMDAMNEGRPFEEFLEELEPKLRAKGWWGKKIVIDPKTGKATDAFFGTPWRLNTIYNTNLNTLFQCGKYRRLTRPSEKNPRPYWQYIAMPGARPSHADYHGKIFRADDPIWQKIYPLNGFG